MSNLYCAVPGCKSLKRKKPHLSFHAFPKAGSERVYVQTRTGRQMVDRQQVWIKKLRISREISYYMKVCSLHFVDSDYFHRYIGESTKKRNLKRNAVPSVNLPGLADARRTKALRLKLKLRSKTIVQNKNKGKKDKLESYLSKDYAANKRKVPECRSWRKRNPEIIFHKFPDKGQNKVYCQTELNRLEWVDRQQVWVNRLKIKRKVTKFMKVCCLHFADTDYMKNVRNVKRVLKKTAIPSQNLPQLQDLRHDQHIHTDDEKPPVENEEMSEEWLDDPLSFNQPQSFIKNTQPSSSTRSALPNKIQGRRIIDLQYFFEKLQKIGSHKTTPSCSIASLSILKEIYIGFNSDLLIRCNSCSTNFTCPLSDPVLTDLAEVNRSAIAGSVAAGIDYKGLTLLFDNIGIPTMTEEKFTELLTDDCKTEMREEWNSGDETNMPVEVFIKQECDTDTDYCDIDIKDEFQ